ncbi:hypothetical protein [Francisella adeliensis]|uniref:hypothetical protein n=1 Tax=Francisella adeliensis TaxID=2007306 RepID=UPI0019055030|nr:hypothetical protein [Francisella adeliensis]MBK2085927.1 hypothetical protein [Francisella adeliensis]
MLKRFQQLGRLEKIITSFFLCLGILFVFSCTNNYFFSGHKMDYPDGASPAVKSIIDLNNKNL